MSELQKISIPKCWVNIDTVMNSGQCFSISKIDDAIYQVLSAESCAYVLTDSSDSLLEVIHPDGENWFRYFGKALSGASILKDLGQSSNEFIRECAEYSNGMIILCQDLWETVVSFIISQRRSIPSIRSSLNRIRKRYGALKHFPEDGNITPIKFPDFYSFPGPDVLSKVSVDELNREAGLGYRAEYVIEAAKWFCNSDNVDRLLSASSYEEHMEILKEIKGIGDKVANCICLFALEDAGAFPVDTWIQRALDKGVFTLEDVKNYPYKGFVQQVIFYYIINHKEQFM